MMELSKKNEGVYVVDVSSDLDTARGGAQVDVEIRVDAARVASEAALVERRERPCELSETTQGPAGGRARVRTRVPSAPWSRAAGPVA